MPLATAEIGAHTHSGTAAGDADSSRSVPTWPALQVDARTRLERLQWLLARAPLAHAALTTIICSYVVQHPGVVLVLMLGFPALLIAQEAVDRRLLVPAALPQEGVQSRQEESSVEITGASEVPRRTLPRGTPSVTDGAPADTGTSAAA